MKSLSILRWNMHWSLPSSLQVKPLAWILIVTHWYIKQNSWLVQCIKTLLNVCRSGNFFFQALYFSYGFGAFVSPLIAEPFLSGTPHPDLGLPAARRGNPLPYGGMGHRSHHKLSHRPTNHLRDAYYPGSEQYKSEVQVAYWIIALAHVSFSK